MSWPRFLLIALPLALFALAAIAEGGVFALKGVSPRRHDLDLVVAALDHAKLNAPVVVGGDSVTQDILKTYQIAPPGKIANLTTNQASGLIGAAFLLRRYLEHNAPPRHLVIAATPEFYGYQPTGEAARVYLTSVFRRPSEKEELVRLGIGSPDRWWPAALMVKERLWDRVTGLLAPAVADLPLGDAIPEPAELDPAPILPHMVAQITERKKAKLEISSSARRAFELICAASAQHNFALHFVRAPLPKSVLAVWGANENLNAMLRAATAGCAAVVIDDMNSRQDFPDYAFSDPDHLRRPNWTALYGRLLSDYVMSLMTDRT